MGLLADFQIQRGGFINPLELGKSRPGRISYGVGSYGYDCRVGYKFKIFTNVHGAVVDPKNFDPRSFVDVDLSDCQKCNGEGGWIDNGEVTICYDCGGNPKPNFILIPPNSFALAESIEEFNIPRDILAVCLGKSTYARCGIVVNITPLEPEWKGKITIEISNTTPLPAKVYTGEGIAQILFFKTEETCLVSYADKKGVYQQQRGIELPKVRING